MNACAIHSCSKLVPFMGQEILISTEACISPPLLIHFSWAEPVFPLWFSCTTTFIQDDVDLPCHACATFICFCVNLFYANSYIYIYRKHTHKYYGNNISTNQNTTNCNDKIRMCSDDKKTMKECGKYKWLQLKTWQVWDNRQGQDVSLAPSILARESSMAMILITIYNHWVLMCMSAFSYLEKKMHQVAIQWCIMALHNWGSLSASPFLHSHSIIFFSWFPWVYFVNICVVFVAAHSDFCGSINVRGLVTEDAAHLKLNGSLCKQTCTQTSHMLFLYFYCSSPYWWS